MEQQFIVSARKYRPATFETVVGQGHITETLKNAIERNQLAHAYLFCGPRGVGKTTCARIFAKAINCLAPIGAEACNECDSCRTFNEGRSLNIHELDAASNNSVEDIRALIEQVRIIPQVGRYSVFIIDEVHMLSQAAFNAFLKTLEEPPQHAIFILATTEKHKIIPTILSRCQIYDFNRIRVEDTVAYLRQIASREGVTADEQALMLIAQKADGGMRDALSMFDKAVSFCGNTLEYKAVASTLGVLDYDTYFGFCQMLYGGDYISALTEFDKVLMAGFSGQVFMGGLSQHLRDLLVIKSGAESLIEFGGELLARYRAQAAAIDHEFLFNAISLLSAADSTIRTSTNQRLLVELTLMKIANLSQKKNADLNDPLEENYPLPSLDNTPQTTVAQQVTPQPAAQAAPIQAPATVQTAAVQAPAPAPAPTPAPAPQPRAAYQPEVVKAQSYTPQPTQRSATRGFDSFVNSLSQQLNLRKSGTDENGDVIIDPQSEQKLIENQQAFIKAILALHPRLNAAFNNLVISGNKVRLEALTTGMESDLNDCRSELAEIIARVAGINGDVNIEVVLNEVEVHLRPVRLEDRYECVRAANPEMFDLICKTFDLTL